jgi:hypothetical protein
MCSLYGNNTHLSSRIFKNFPHACLKYDKSVILEISAILHLGWIIESYCDDFTMCLVNIKCLHVYCILV